MNEFRATIQAAREAFTDGLLVSGFRRVDPMIYAGDIDVGGRPVEHLITVPDDFPTVVPKVRTTDGTGGMSWHREADGHFCLWSTDEASHLPWADASAVIARIVDWHTQAAAGWPGDPPDLDLERYWPQGAGLIVHDDLEPLVGTLVRVVRGRHGEYRVKPGPPIAKSRKHVLAARVVDIGDLAEPVHTLDELLDRLGATLAGRVRREVTDGRVPILLVRYQRQGHQGVLGLLVDTLSPIKLVSLRTAHGGASTMTMRAGTDAPTLSGKSVAVVGLGSVGSHVADLLARSGVGHLTFIDGSVLRPGNCVRHLASPAYVGLSKAEAVKAHLLDAGVAQPADIEVIEQSMTSVELAERTFESHDLVIDATGDGPATALLLLASKELNRPAVTVCLQHDGRIARVDRSPLAPGEVYSDPVAATQILHPGLREGGCGDPVSPSPPWAVMTAASLVTGMATDMLTDRNQYPPTTIQVLVSEPGVSGPVGTMN